MFSICTFNLQTMPLVELSGLMNNVMKRFEKKNLMMIVLTSPFWRVIIHRTFNDTDYPSMISCGVDDFKLVKNKVMYEMIDLYKNAKGSKRARFNEFFEIWYESKVLDDKMKYTGPIKPTKPANPENYKN